MRRLIAFCATLGVVPHRNLCSFCAQAGLAHCLIQCMRNSVFGEALLCIGVCGAGYNYTPWQGASLVSTATTPSDACSDTCSSGAVQVDIGAARAALSNESTTCCPPVKRSYEPGLEMQVWQDLQQRYRQLLCDVRAGLATGLGQAEAGSTTDLHVSRATEIAETAKSERSWKADICSAADPSAQAAEGFWWQRRWGRGAPDMSQLPVSCACNFVY